MKKVIFFLLNFVFNGLSIFCMEKSGPKKLDVITIPKFCPCNIKQMKKVAAKLELFLEEYDKSEKIIVYIEYFGQYEELDHKLVQEAIDLLNNEICINKQVIKKRLLKVIKTLWLLIFYVPILVIKDAKEALSC